MIYLYSEPIELLNTKPRRRRETEDDDDAADVSVLPRMPNPVACLSSGDMLIFHLTINHTGVTGLLYSNAGRVMIVWFIFLNLTLTLFYVL